MIKGALDVVGGRNCSTTIITEGGFYWIREANGGMQKALPRREGQRLVGFSGWLQARIIRELYPRTRGGGGGLEGVNSRGFLQR